MVVKQVDRTLWKLVTQCCLLIVEMGEGLGKTIVCLPVSVSDDARRDDAQDGAIRIA